MLLRSTKSRPWGSLTRPPKTRWSLLMGGPLASNRSALQSAFVARCFERGLAARASRLGDPVDQRLDRAAAGVAGDVKLAELFATGFLGGIGCAPCPFGYPAPHRPKQSLFGPGL